MVAVEGDGGSELAGQGAGLVAAIERDQVPADRHAVPRELTLVVGAGAAFLVADAWDCRDAGPEGCHLHNDGYSENNITGSILVISGLSLALLTAIVVAAQGPAPATSPPPVP